jgi:hypothetical protein
MWFKLTFIYRYISGLQLNIHLTPSHYKTPEFCDLIVRTDLSLPAERKLLGHCLSLAGPGVSPLRHSRLVIGVIHIPCNVTNNSNNNQNSENEGI